VCDGIDVLVGVGDGGATLSKFAVISCDWFMVTVVERLYGSPTGPVHLMKNQPGFVVAVMGITESSSTVLDPGGGSVVPPADGSATMINVVVCGGMTCVSPQGAAMMMVPIFLRHT
jgi:hypothetical protein